MLFHNLEVFRLYFSSPTLSSRVPSQAAREEGRTQAIKEAQKDPVPLVLEPAVRAADSGVAGADGLA